MTLAWYKPINGSYCRNITDMTDTVLGRLKRVGGLIKMEVTKDSETLTGEAYHQNGAILFWVDRTPPEPPEPPIGPDCITKYGFFPHKISYGGETHYYYGSLGGYDPQYAAHNPSATGSTEKSVSCCTTWDGGSGWVSVYDTFYSSNLRMMLNSSCETGKIAVQRFIYSGTNSLTQFSFPYKTTTQSVRSVDASVVSGIWVFSDKTSLNYNQTTSLTDTSASEIPCPWPGTPTWHTNSNVKSYVAGSTEIPLFAGWLSEDFYMEQQLIETGTLTPCGTKTLSYEIIYRAKSDDRVLDSVILT